MGKIFSELSKKKYLIFLIILVAIFFRFWQLNKIPPGLYPDIATNGTDAIRANETLNYKIFYPANNGREGLFINLIALSFKIFGTGVWQLRLAGSIIGVLTVYGVYLLTKEILDEKSALFSSLFISTSFWAVNFSRIGFRAVMVPFILVFAFYFLLRNIFEKNKSIWDFIISGIIFGLGFYTYISFKIAPLILLFILGFFIIKNLDTLKKYWKYIFLCVIAITIVALPIIIYQVTSKDAALRTGQVSIFNPEVNKGNLIGTAIKTTSLSLGMFNFYGDPNWRHNFSGLPALNFFVGIFFLVGIIIFIKELFNKKGSLKKKFAGFFIISWFVIMLIPAILTEEGMPHSLRAIGSMVPAFIVSGFGAGYIYSVFSIKKKGIVKKIAPVLTIAIIISDFSLYFFVWAKKQQVIDQFTSRYVEIANYLNKMPDSFDKYVIIDEPGTMVDDFPVQTQTIKFLTYKKSNVTFLNKEDVEKVDIKKPSIFTDLKNDKEMTTLLTKNTMAKNINSSEVITPYESTNFIIYCVDLE